MAASKQYRHLRGTTPAFAEKPEYQDRINEKKEEILKTPDGNDTNRLAALLVKREYERKALYAKYQSVKTTDVEYEINLYRTALAQLITSAMMSQGMEEVRLTSGELVSLKDTAVLEIEDKEKAQEWALANIPELFTIKSKGLTAIQIQKLAEWGAKHKLTIEMSLSDTDLKTLGRDCAAQGRPTPPGMKMTPVTQAKVYGLNNGSSDDE